MSKLRAEQLETLDGLHTKNVETLVDDLNAAEVTTSTGTQTVAGALDQRVIYVDTIADLQALDTNGLVDGQAARVSTTGRAGNYVWSALTPKSQHGIIGWSPSVPSVSQQSGSTLAERVISFLDGAGETSPSGQGLWLFVGQPTAEQLFSTDEELTVLPGVIEKLIGIGHRKIIFSSATIGVSEKIVISADHVQLIATNTKFEPVGFSPSAVDSLFEVTGDDIYIPVLSIDLKGENVGGSAFVGTSGLRIDKAEVFNMGGDDYGKEGLRITNSQDYQVGSFLLGGDVLSTPICTPFRIESSPRGVVGDVFGTGINSSVLQIVGEASVDIKVGTVTALDARNSGFYTNNVRGVTVDSIYVRAVADPGQENNGIKLSRNSQNVVIKHVDIEIGPGNNTAYAIFLQGASHCSILSGSALVKRRSGEPSERGCIAIEDHPITLDSAEYNYIGAIRQGYKTIDGSMANGVGVSVRERAGLSVSNNTFDGVMPYDPYDPSITSSFLARNNDSSSAGIDNLLLKNCFFVSRSPSSFFGGRAIYTARQGGGSILLSVHNCLAHSVDAAQTVNASGRVSNVQARNQVAITDVISCNVVINSAASNGAATGFSFSSQNTNNVPGLLEEFDV